MHKIDLKNVVWKEDKYYVAQCLNADVSIFGKTKKEALKALDEALELYFKEIPFGTFKSILRQANLTEDEFRQK